jgi:outer membrane lipoprotein-sorting protein
MKKTNSRATWPSLRNSGIFALILAATSVAEPLDAILSRMDAAAKTSNSFSANLTHVDYTKIVDSKFIETGSIKLRKKGGRVFGRMDIEKPAPFTWNIAGDTFEKFAPKANLVTVYKVAKITKAADRYLLLAFGTSGADLRKDYDVKGGPEETIDGVKTTRLDLVPKDKKTREEYAARIEMWVPIGQTYAAQLKATEPNGDYTMYSYSEQKLNPPIPESAFIFTPPPGAKREQAN